MNEFYVLMVILAVGCVLSGPIALVIGIIALNKTKQVYRQLRDKNLITEFSTKAKTTVDRIRQPQQQVPPTHTSHEESPQEKTAERKPEPAKVQEPQKLSQIAYQNELQRVIKKEKKIVAQKVGTLEQRIGTRWVLIAGIITVIVGVGFFLKYAYDNALVGPLGRVVIAVISGIIALAVGEVTRKRGYGIVAKAVTAMGFAILYAAVFSAYRFYELIGSTPALVLAILITAAAMLYAVSLNEILIAVLSLVGGFLTPIIVTTGENVPIPLFTYCLILGMGAMLCAYYRKWRAVHLIAFIGTFALYTGWFEKFFRPAIRTDKTPEQMAIALSWLTVFFIIYLVMPLLYGLVKKLKAQKEDVLLVLSNAAVTFYYLWTILFANYRMELAFCAIGLCIAHLFMMSIVIKRCKEDINLRLALLAIGLIFLTVAIPLYLKMYAVAMAWAIEAVVLTIIGLRYKSIWTQVGAAAVLMLSLGQLIYQLPMHTAVFNLVFNPAFGSWLFVSATIVVCHILYRRKSKINPEYPNIISQILYAIATFVLMAAFTMEWYWHCDYNIIKNIVGDTYFINGMMLIFTIFTLLLLVRVLCPQGQLCRILATILAVAGSLFTMFAFTESYHNSFIIFANANFAIALLFVAGLFTGAWLLKQTCRQKEGHFVFPLFFALAAIFVLWILLTEQIYLYWYCKNRYLEKITNWGFLANMYISIIWAIYAAALMALGFWRKIRLMRYISLGLFALLLAKVFIMDTSTVKSVYRIAAFLATGVTLVAVSYLYQFLKKKGFFEVMLAEKVLDE